MSLIVVSDEVFGQFKIMIELGIQQVIVVDFYIDLLLILVSNGGVWFKFEGWGVGMGIDDFCFQLWSYFFWSDLGDDSFILYYVLVFFDGWL